MSSMISLHLLICILVFLPSCCRGHKRFIIKDGLKIDSNNWYRNLGINELEYYIDRSVKSTNLFFGLHLAGVENGSPTYGQFIDSQLSEDGYSVYWSAEIISRASRFISADKCLLHEGEHSKKCSTDLSKVRLDKTSLGEKCLSMYYNKTACIGMNLKYRSPDGSCNNLKRSYSGKATTAYNRLLLNGYYDNFHTILDGSGRSSLPNARKLSIALVNDENSPDDLKTMAIAYWTIFVGHDLSHTAISSHKKNNKPVICCNHNYELSPRDRNELCMQIVIDDRSKDRDPFFDFRCMNYVRSVPAVSSDCTFGPREQMNQATHYLDGSMVYGSSAKRTWSLRTKSDGQLFTDMGCDNKGQGDTLQPRYMPLEDTESNACQYGSGTCYRAGDPRANTLPQLTVMHTLWMREHNRLAKLLSHVNPHWSDERIFQEARKIVTASIQHITYAEWLPALLGENFTRQYGLELLTKGYSNAYNETSDPSVSNSFATAILPFANSMITESINLYTEDRVMNGSLSLKEHFNRPIELLTNYMDQLVRGLSTQNTQKVDMLFTKTITNYLYTVHPDNIFGMDVFSLDVQRNRDHGIRFYTKYREYCGLKPIKNEQDLSQIMMEGSTDKLLAQYKHWENIELLVGALLEKHEDVAMVGPTMRCIIKEQFIRTRIADRYFYDLPNVFNKYQLTEIRKVTLARVFCDNSNNITSMQKQVFLKPTAADLQLCSSKLIPKININHWSEMVDTF
ncbi:peroxidase-like isoform X2 [Myzus persicae]|nr:peroxidase-like isoform X2 [Myzus persicae]